MDGGLSRGNKAAFSNSPPQRGRAPSLETHMLDFTRAHQVTFIEMSWHQILRQILYSVLLLDKL